MANIRNIIIPFAMGLFISLISCKQKETYRDFSGAVWHTSYNIQYEAAKDLNDSIVNVFKEVEATLSAFNDSSLISRVNKSHTPLMCNTMLTELFNESKRINLISKGAFDPTVGPLVNMWGFGRNRDSVKTVSPVMIDSALARVGIDDCRIDVSGKLIKKHPDTEFNFSAIAKGYACDKISEMFNRNGLKNYLIEIGGEIVLKGHNPKNSSWRIMIESPITDSQWDANVIELADGAVASSGNYRNYREIDGQIVSHTISPFTGYPIQTDILAVTVVAPSCMTADAVATACMVMNLDSAYAMVDRIPNVEALFITGIGQDGKPSVITTKKFPSRAHNK